MSFDQICSQNHYENMKSSPTFDELKENVIESHKRMIGDSGQLYATKSSKDFAKKHIDLICKLRRNSIFSLGFSQNASDVIQIKDLNSEYPKFQPPTKIPNTKVDFSCSQFYTTTVFYFIFNPDQLASLFLDYLNKEDQKKQATDIYIFAYLIFPSIYAYFTYPELRKLAVDLIDCFINQKSFEIVSHLICSFFQNAPQFMSHLFDLFEEKSIMENKPKTSIIYFNYFIESLEAASSLLTSLHDEIANKALKIGPKFFIRTFIERLFLSNYKLLNPHGILIQIFEFIMSGQSIAPFQLISKILTKKKHRYPDLITQFGGMSGVDIKSFTIFTSAYEIQIMIDLYSSSKQSTSLDMVKKSVANLTLDKFQNYRVECYPTFQHPIPVLKSTLFPPFKKANFKRINEEYRRGFTSICSYSKKIGIDPIIVFVPESVDSNNEMQIKSVASFMQRSDMNNFLKFSFMMLSNSYADSVSHLDYAFALKLGINDIDNMSICADLIFENQMVIYTNSDQMTVNDFLLKRNLSSIPNNFCDKFDVKADSFKIVYIKLIESYSKYSDLSTFDQSNFRRIKLLINNILNIDSYYFKIRKLAIYLNEIYESANELVKKDPGMNIDKGIFVILYTLVDDWKLFLNVFIIYLIEFQKDISNDYFARILKKSWDRLNTCFQNAVYDLSPSIQAQFDYILNGASGSAFM